MLAGTVQFLTERILADGPDLMPAYTVAGQPIPDEHGVPLRGYPGGTTRIGNRVAGQFQLDGLGECLELFAAAAGLDMLAEENWQAAAVAAGAIEKRWSEPDAGISELGDRHWTHSRLACVSGLRSLAAAVGGPPDGPGQRQAARWSTLADALLASLGDRTPLTMIVPPVILVVAAIVVGLIGQLGPAVQAAAVRFEDQAGYNATVLNGAHITHPVALFAAGPTSVTATDVLAGLGSVIGALILAGLALYWRRLPLLRGYQPNAPLA